MNKEIKDRVAWDNVDKDVVTSVYNEYQQAQHYERYFLIGLKGTMKRGKIRIRAYPQ